MGIQIEPDLDHNMQYIQGLQKISAKLIHMMNCGTCQYTSPKQLHSQVDKKSSTQQAYFQSCYAP